MTGPLPPWCSGPFELLVHAEGHRQNGDDFDRRISLISFDNAIEVAISTYLTLNPIQRGNRSFPKPDVEKWMNNYYTKLDFLEAEIAKRGGTWVVPKAEVLWVHDHRNEQYHGGHKGTPEKNVLIVARKAALWVFGLLFDVAEPEAALEHAMIDQAPPTLPSRDKSFDIAIDESYGVIQVGEERYYASELLFSVDANAYRELGQRLCASDDESFSEPKPRTSESVRNPHTRLDADAVDSDDARTSAKATPKVREEEDGLTKADERTPRSVKGNRRKGA